MNQYEVLADVVVINGVELNKGDLVELELVNAEGLMAEGKIAVAPELPKEEAVVAEGADESVAVDPALEGSEETVVSTMKDGEISNQVHTGAGVMGNAMPSQPQEQAESNAALMAEDAQIGGVDLGVQQAA